MANFRKNTYNLRTCRRFNRRFIGNESVSSQDKAQKIYNRSTIYIGASNSYVTITLCRATVAKLKIRIILLLITNSGCRTMSAIDNSVVG